MPVCSLCKVVFEAAPECPNGCKYPDYMIAEKSRKHGDYVTSTKRTSGEEAGKRSKYPWPKHDREARRPERPPGGA